MKSLLVSVVASTLGMALGLTTACAPAVDLKQPRTKGIIRQNDVLSK